MSSLYSMVVNLIGRVWQHFRTDSLFQNSIYLMLSTGVMAVLGFVFWIFGAKFFTPSEVGVASSLISVSGIITSLCIFGFNNSIIRYLPNAEDKNKILSSAVTLTALSSVFASLIALIALSFVIPALAAVAHNWLLSLLFIIFTLFNSLNIIFENTFIALRSSSNVLVKNTLLSIVKLAAPFFLLSLAAYGIYTALLLGMASACAYSVYILQKSFKLSYRPLLDWQILRSLFAFSVGNYFISLLTTLPGLLIPIIITAKLGAAASGYYYIDFLIVSLLFIIPSATANSFFAEGSQGKVAVRPIIFSSIKIAYGILLPGIVAILALGSFVLTILNKNYAAEGANLLSVMALSGIFVTFNYLSGAFLNIHHRIGRLVLVNFLGVVFVLTSVFYFLHFGLIGIGLGWIVGQALISVAYAVAVFTMPHSIFSNSGSRVARAEP